MSSPLNTKTLTGAGDTPNTSTLSSLWFGNDTERTQVGFVQSIPEFLKTPEPITYSALDIDDERMAPGRKKAEALEIETLFTTKGYKEVKEQNGKTNTWYIQLPDETAENPEDPKPLTWSFSATSYIGIGELAIDDMIKSKITIYRSGAIVETEGFPST